MVNGNDVLVNEYKFNTQLSQTVNGSELGEIYGKYYFSRQHIKALYKISQFNPFIY